MRFLRLIAVLLHATAVPFVASAQGITWTPRADLNDTLPASVRIFEGESPAPLRAWYAEVDLSAGDVFLKPIRSDAGGGVETVPDMVADQDVLIAINAGYFGSGQLFSLHVAGGELVTPNIGALSRGSNTFFPTRSAFGQLSDGSLDVAWVYDINRITYAYPNPSPNMESTPQPRPSPTFPAGGMVWNAQDAVGGGPVLVENGQRNITWEAEVFFGSGIGAVTDRNPRTAVGYTADGKVLLLVVDGRNAFRSVGLSLIELADVMISLGAVEAINLDGGGSSTFVANDTVLNSPPGGLRAVANALAIFTDPDGGDDGGNEAEQFFDTGDACCYSESTGWFESANTPFYGTTPSRLNEIGDGSDRAAFMFEDIETGRYMVDAWWVPSFNRATNTPYIVYQQGAGTTVRVDQSDAATLNQWNPLGTFDLAPGDSVVVTDDAVGSATPAFVVADALRLTRVSGVRTEPVHAQPETTLALYPNPAGRNVTLDFAMPSAGSVHVTLFDLLGRVVFHDERSGHAGSNRWSVDLPGLAPGLYMARVQTATRVMQQPLMVRMH